MSKKKVATTMPVLAYESMCLLAEDCPQKKCNPKSCSMWRPRTLHPALFELVMAWAEYRELNIDERNGVLSPRLKRMDDAVLTVTSWDVRKL